MSCTVVAPDAVHETLHLPRLAGSVNYHRAQAVRPHPRWRGPALLLAGAVVGLVAAAAVLVGPTPLPTTGGPVVAAALQVVATPPVIPNPTPSTAAADQEDPRVVEALGSLTSDADLAGQLLLVGWPGDTAEQARATIRELKPAGLVYVDNTHSSAQALAINSAVPIIAEQYGALPLLLAVDHEGGLVQRISDVTNYGSNAAFAATGPSDTDACLRGQNHAQQLQSLGFNMNLAPVLDVNNNPNNPVIGTRSYGADPELVARLGSAYIRGLQAGGIIAVGKHFPGHGNTGVDSHLQLPILPHSIDDLEQIELVPFRRAIAPETNVAAIMSAHIVFPAVDPSGAPATLSYPIMTGILRNRLGFDGLVLSDDLVGMKAITDNYSAGDAAVRSIGAGVDLLIMAGGLPRQVAARDALVAALASGELSRDRVQEAVQHVLRVKARFGLLDGSVPAVAGC
jgi:beta-N-acetylhexosaminidase